MELTKEEFQVLWQVEEGNGSSDAIISFTNLSVTMVKKILKKLERLRLVELKIKHDVRCKEEFWDAKTTENAKPLFEKYKNWIPEN